MHLSREETPNDLHPTAMPQTSPGAHNTGGQLDTLWVMCIWTADGAWCLSVCLCCCVSSWYCLLQNPYKPHRTSPDTQLHTSICTRVHGHACTHRHTSTCAHMPGHTHTHTSTRAYTHMDTHILTGTHPHVHKHLGKHTHRHTATCPHMPGHTHTHRYTSTHTHGRTYTHRHTSTCAHTPGHTHSQAHSHIRPHTWTDIPPGHADVLCVWDAVFCLAVSFVI